MNVRAWSTVPWAVAAAALIALVCRQKLWAPDSSGPTTAVALDGGGVSDGSECGVKDFHYFALPTASSSPASPGTPPAGPQMVLGPYGYERTSDAPGHFTIQLLFAPRGKQALTLSRTLGAEGVAVEIEGPHGLVGGAHGLPVTWNRPTAADRDNTMHIDAGDGGSAEVSLPLEALCPGYEGAGVMKELVAPIDSTNTITGQPPYTLTVSVSDPGIGELRTTVHSAISGDLLSADNLVPLDEPIARP
ncbi:hypothetical protein [Streptomyces sp. NPDC101149]|uniref:hypothetical protein n=1 Tax=Streptomyces sp. NPDC101149 TaxID=3366113 RepID=UPI0038234444